MDVNKHDNEGNGGNVAVLASRQLQSTAIHQRYITAATSANTRRAYRSAIRQFEKWGGRLPCQPSVLIHYLTEKAGRLNPRTLDLHLTAIRQWHKTQSLTDPTVDIRLIKIMEGIRRTHGKPKQKAKALRLEHIAKMVSVLQPSTDMSLKQHRDLAIVLVGFFGAFRRSELVSICCTNLYWEPEGLVIKISKSKTDQMGDGIIRALPFGTTSVCAATALKTWLTRARIKDGPVFRSINRWDQVSESTLQPGAINLILKSVAKHCDWDFIPELSSHSFRRGLSTSAAREKIEFELIKKQGGWKSDATVWEYIEEGQQFSENAANQLMEKVSTLVEKD